MSDLPPSLAGQGMIGIDLETCDPELKTRGPGMHRGSYICGVSIGTEAGFRAYLPVAHEVGPNLDKRKVYSWLGKQLKLKVPKVGARLVYDIGFLIQEGIPFVGPFYDIQVAEPLLDENQFTYNLDRIAKHWVGEGKSSDRLKSLLESRFGKKNPLGNIWRAPADASELLEYVLADTDRPLRVFAKQRTQLEKEDLWDLFLMESKLTELLARMHLRGVRVDIKATEELDRAYKAEYDELLADVKHDTGVEVNVWAARSLAKVFDHLGIQYPLTAKTKQPSFQAAWLEGLDDPIGENIRRLRWLDKMRGTFLQGSILEKAHDGRVHTQFNQLKSDEGGTIARFSSKQPNLQFIPTRTEEGKKVRSLFLPDEGQSWYKLDYSQIEYRLIAHDAYCAELKGAADVVQKYRDDPDTDFHEVIAAMVFGPNFKKEQRASAKTINFGLAYGEGVAKLAKQLGLSLDDAEDLLKQYHRNAPFIKPLAQGFMNMAAQQGEVRTLLKRKRRFSMWVKDVRDPATGMRKPLVLPHRFPGSKRAFTHKALNARTQGGAADIMKNAMADVWESGIVDVLGVPQLTVHDELDGSMPPGKAGREAVRELKHVMESTVKLSVPLLVDAEVGKNWGSTSKMK